MSGSHFVSLYQHTIQYRWALRNNRRPAHSVAARGKKCKFIKRYNSPRPSPVSRAIVDFASAYAPNKKLRRRHRGNRTPRALAQEKYELVKAIAHRSGRAGGGAANALGGSRRYDVAKARSLSSSIAARSGLVSASPPPAAGLPPPAPSYWLSGLELLVVFAFHNCAPN